MLTEEQIYENKIRFMTLLSKLAIDLTDLSKYLDVVDYFNQPASAQYFKSYKGGLCQYALDLYFELAQLCNAYFPGRYTEQDVIKVSLLKDIYKAELYESYLKNVKDESGNWTSITAYKVADDRNYYGDAQFSSYMIAKQFIELTEEQILAIVHSKIMDSYTPDIHEILRKYPLVNLIRMADMAATYIDN